MLLAPEHRWDTKHSHGSWRSSLSPGYRLMARAHRPVTDQLGVDLSDLIVQSEVITNPEVQVHVVPFSVSPTDPVLQALAGLPEVH